MRESTTICMDRCKVRLNAQERGLQPWGHGLKKDHDMRLWAHIYPSQVKHGVSLELPFQEPFSMSFTAPLSALVRFNTLPPALKP